MPYGNMAWVTSFAIFVKITYWSKFYQGNIFSNWASELYFFYSFPNCYLVN